MVMLLMVAVSRQRWSGVGGVDVGVVGVGVVGCVGVGIGAVGADGVGVVGVAVLTWYRMAVGVGCCRRSRFRVLVA